MIQPYWKSVNIGDPKLVEFFSGSRLVVEEKVDGSQFSFGKIGGKLFARSRSKALDLDAPEKMFRAAVDHVKSVEALLPDNFIFRGEAVTSIRHNTIKYSRTPNGFVVLFGGESYITGEIIPAQDLIIYAEHLGMDITPTIFELDPDELQPEEIIEQLRTCLQLESFLGGALVEGVAVKRLSKPIYYMDRPIFAKLVSEAFKETHKKVWRDENPTRNDVIELLSDELATPQRFEKAVQHLREAGNFTGTVADIGNLIIEVRRDITEECSEYIKERLFKWAQDKVSRAASKRVPEWYKKKLEDDLVKAIAESRNAT